MKEFNLWCTDLKFLEILIRMDVTFNEFASLDKREEKIIAKIYHKKGNFME